MPLVIFCEKCNFQYQAIAFTDKHGTTDGQMSKCPKCGNWNGTGYLLDKLKDMQEKK